MRHLILQGKPATIVIPIQVKIELRSWKNILDQVGNQFVPILRDITKVIFQTVTMEILRQIKEHNPHLRLYHERTREIVTMMGSVQIKDFEGRLSGGRSLGRTTKRFLGLNDKEHLLESTKQAVGKILSKLSYRESTDLLKLWWDKCSAQRLNYWVLKQTKVKKTFVRIQQLTKRIKRQILLYLDGNVLKIRQRKGAVMERTTLQVVMKEALQKGLKRTTIAFSFLEYGYEKLIRSVISDKEKRGVVALADGERKIEEALKRVGVTNFQRCLWHFFHNLTDRLVSEGTSREGAGTLVDNVRKICYVPKKQLKNIYRCWGVVIKKRKEMMMEYIEALRNDKKKSSAEYIERALPYLFTYIKYYCRHDYGFWIGRTVNRLERLNRRITHRMKRVGAVWSPTGAYNILSFILADYFRYRYTKTPPCSAEVTTTVIII